MTKVAKELGIEKGNTKWGEIADILEKTMLDRKNLYPNVDFPSAYAYYLLGIPIDLYTPLFVVARLAGYTAHAIEQLENNRLIRPKAIYEGDANLEYVPLASR
jgi:citrate synthase